MTRHPEGRPQHHAVVLGYHALEANRFHTLRHLPLDPG